MLNDEQLKIYSQYINKGFDQYQLEEIHRGIKSNLAVDQYAKIENAPIKMYTMRIAMSHNLDLTSYLNMGFSGDQLYEICLGILEGLDISLYAKTNFTSNKMRRIRKVLEHKLDPYNLYTYSYYPTSLIKIDEYLDFGIDISDYFYKLNHLDTPAIIDGNLHIKDESILKKPLIELIMERGISLGIDKAEFTPFINSDPIILAEYISFKALGLDTEIFKYYQNYFYSYNLIRLSLLSKFNILDFISPDFNSTDINVLYFILLNKCDTTNIKETYKQYGTLEGLYNSLMYDITIDVNEIHEDDYYALIEQKLKERRQKEYQRMVELGLL